MYKLDEDTIKKIQVKATEYASYKVVKKFYSTINDEWVITPTQVFAELGNDRYTAYDANITVNPRESHKIEIKSRNEEYHLNTFSDIQVNKTKIDKLLQLDSTPILVGIYPSDAKIAIWDVAHTNYTPTTQYSSQVTISEGDATTKLEKEMYSFPIDQANIFDIDIKEWYSSYWREYYFHYCKLINEQNQSN